MENVVYYSALFDYYGELLTTVQQDYFKAYYFDNLSLSEIADNFKVSRNAISKTLKEVTQKLDFYEQILNLNKNKIKIKELLNNNPDILEKIDKYI
jgi:uncharacterized protein